MMASMLGILSSATFSRLYFYDDGRPLCIE